MALCSQIERRGLSVRLLEAGSRPGGVISTERVEGWVIDAGPDSLLVQKPGAVALCRELGIAGRLVSTLTPRTAYVLRDGQLHPLVEGSFLGFPIKLGALARSTLFTVGGKPQARERGLCGCGRPIVPLCGVAGPLAAVIPS